jgi:N-acetylmuramoyl-L-alanine amidase
MQGMRKRMLVSIGLIIILSGFSIRTLVNTIQVPELKIYSVTVEPIPAETVHKVDIIPVIDAPAPVSADTPAQENEYSISEDDKALLTKIAKAEAGDQDIKGKALVIRVVFNRKEYGGFPDSIREIIYQEDQFSPVKEGKFEEAVPDEECWKALEMVVLEGWDESQGALYFESDGKSTWHRDNLKYLFSYEDHSFYTEREGEQ